MTNPEIISLVVSSSLATTLVNQLLNWRLRKAEIRKKTAEVTAIVAQTYSGIIEDLKAEINRLKTLNNELHAENIKLQKMVKNLLP